MPCLQYCENFSYHIYLSMIDEAIISLSLFPLSLCIYVCVHACVYDTTHTWCSEDGLGCILPPLRQDVPEIFLFLLLTSPMECWDCRHVLLPCLTFTWVLSEDQNSIPMFICQVSHLRKTMNTSENNGSYSEKHSIRRYQL